MNKILSKVHQYEITAPKEGAKDQRWQTYVPDTTKMNGRRCVKRNSKEALEAFLYEFYAIGDKKFTFEKCFFDWVDYKRQFINSNNTKRRLSETTITRYIRDYNNTIKGTPLADVSIKSLNPIKLTNMLIGIITTKYYSNKTDKRNHTNGHRLYQSSATNILGYINSALEHAYLSDIITSNPFEKVDRNLLLSMTDSNPVDAKVDTEQVLSSDEYKTLYLAVKRHEEAHPTYMPNYAIELAILTGMRVGEISALHWSDIKNNHIYIDYSEHRIDHADGTYSVEIGEPKNKKHRRIPITTEIQNLFNRIKALGIESEFVFAHEDGTRCTAHEISCAVYRRGDEAGIKRTSIHGIRRTVSSRLREVLSVDAVSALLGHLPRTNEEHYGYDVSTTEAKITALSYVSSNVVNFQELKNNKKIAETLAN